MYALIDTHAHLEEVEDLDQALKRAEKAGVAAIITMGSNQQTNRWALETSRKHVSGKLKIYAALGIHPWGLDASKVDSALNFIRENIERAVGVGEIGLDYWLKDARRDPERKNVQKVLFRRLLEIARDNEKPASIHSRGAWEDCLTIAREVGVKTAVFHWFSGPREVLQGLLKQNYFVSATPAAAYSREHRMAIQMTPLERLVLETDSPVEYRGETSEPAHVIKSLEAVAELKGVDGETVARKTTENARIVFSLDDH